jgi:dTDP-4-dehydrorhamnose 3,5-epimerase
MQVADLPIAGLKLIRPHVFKDARGFFFESYRKPLYPWVDFVQDNMSVSCKNTIRGLHFQSSPGQAKLVSCLQGAIWDVVVDIRPDSPTFGQYEALEINDKTREQLFIPVGFAHGFCVLSETAWVHYKVSHIYDPKTECSIRWNDPDLAIEWRVMDPLVSERDAKAPFFKEVFS